MAIDETEVWSTTIALFRTRGVHRVFLKRLAHNDNDKNQIYLGPSLDGLASTLGARLGPGSASESATKQRSAQGVAKPVAHLQWIWIGDGPDVLAPAAKLIYYFQYPEVRFSGFLSGCRNPPDALRKRRVNDYGDRLLLFGSNGLSVFGMVIAAPPGESLSDPPGATSSELSDCLLKLDLERSRDT